MNHSVFEVEKKIVTKAKKELWIKELIFYVGNLSLTDFKTDDRFKEVKNMRAESKFLGLTDEGFDFPVKYPLQLTNGFTIKENDYNFYEYNIDQTD